MNVRSVLALFDISPAALFVLAALFSAWSVPLAAHDFPDTCNYSKELCGWTGIDEAATVIEAARTADQAICALAATAAEPVTLADIVRDSLKTLRQINRWYQLGRTTLDQLATFVSDQPTPNITAEPLDVESLGPSVLTDAVEANPLIGSAAMIVTIEETYLPYDLSANDLRLRSFYPLSTEPFCVRSRAGGWNQVPMWADVAASAAASLDSVASTEESPAGTTHVVSEPISGPVDCWLEELIWRADLWTARLDELNPADAGRQWARIVSRGDRVARQAAELIVSNWPHRLAKPSLSGQALLSRAGASEATAPIHIADVPGATTIR